MARCKITVLKRTVHQDLVEAHAGVTVQPCEFFREGQEFLVSPFEKPAGFCDWAWNDIYKVVLTLSRGGNFDDGIFQDWMKAKKTMVVCCTDGIRPVSFKLEAIQD